MHPLSFVIFYTNKLEKPNLNSPWASAISQKIHRFISKNEEIDQATFYEFLRALVDHNYKSIIQNEHWDSYSNLWLDFKLFYEKLITKKNR